MRKKKSLLYILQHHSQYLFCFGAQHIFEPNNKQFLEIENFWERFLNKTKKQKKIVFVEGGKRPISKNKIEAIRNGGEADFTAWLAAESKIKVDSPEPSEHKERSTLIKKFLKEEIELYYFARYAYQWNSFSKKPSFHKYINDFFESERKQSGWQKFDFSLTHMKKLFKDRMGRKFNHKDKLFLYSIINPTYKSKRTVVNEVSKESEKIRDNYISKRIVDRWNKKENIFIVYGSGHIPSIRRALENRSNK